MIILGVDPGIRHTGWVVLDDQTVVGRGTIVPPGRGKMLVSQALSFILPEIAAVLAAYHPSIASVEEVTWYGKTRRITLPLSHVTGAVAGVCLASGVSVCLLLANMRKNIKGPRGSAKWTEHERDAYALATVLRKHLVALAAGEASALPARSAIPKRIITALVNAHGSG